MDDATPPPADRPAASGKLRRRGLHVPLPAVVVGLGLASTPALAQIPVVARPDLFRVPSGVATTLPVLDNDTLNNAAPTTFLSFTMPKPGMANVIANALVFMPPPGYEGPASFQYCIRSFIPTSNSCAIVMLEVGQPAAVPAIGGLALAGLSGVLGWLGMRLRRRG